MPEAFKYWAFISYSHQDRAWGDWLHRTLESYHVPSRLVGRASRDGEIPKRLSPIFRDRDELPSSADLGGVINEALRASRYQIVICSPRAAASRWVNEEVKYFKSLGRDDRVLCLIVNGEPNVFEIPGRDIEECFCPALRFRVTPQGEVTDQRAEPIAADARGHGDGKASARLKLIAGLIGVGFDEVKQRERRRTFYRRLATAVAATGLIAATYAGWVWQQGEKEAALQEQARIVRNAQLYERARSESLAGNTGRAAVLLHALLGTEHESQALRFMLRRNLEVLESLQDSRDIGLVAHDLVISPDGSRLIAASKTEVALLDPKTLEEIARITPPAALKLDHNIMQPRFSADGRRFCLAWSHRTFTPGTIQVHDAQSGRLLLARESILPEQRRPLAPLSPDGRLLAIVDEKTRVARVVDIDTGAIKAEVPGPQSVTIAAFLTANELVVADLVGNVAIWDIAAGRFKRRLGNLGGSPLSAALSDDRRFLAVGAYNGALRVWELATGALKIAGGHSADVVTLQFSSDGQSLLSVGVSEARLWSTRTGGLISNIERPVLSQMWTTLDQEGNGLLMGDTDGLDVVDVGTRQVRFKLDLHRGGVTAAVLGDRFAYTAGADRRLARWRWPIKPQLRVRHNPTIELDGSDAVWGAHFDAPGARFVTAGSDGLARMFDVKARRLLGVMTGHKASVMDGDFSGNARWIATAGYDKSIRMFDATSYQELWSRTTDGELTVVQFSPDDRLLLVKDWGKRAALLSSQTGEAIPGWEFRAVEAARFVPERDLLLWAAAGKITAYAVHTMERRWEYTLPVPKEGPVGDVWLGWPRGQNIAVGSTSGDAWLLDLDNGKPAAELRAAERGSIFGSGRSNDGRYVALSQSNAPPIIWDTATGATRELPMKGTFMHLGMVGDSIVLIGGTYGVVEAWDAATGQSLGPVGHHGGQIRSLEVSDAGALLTASTDNSVALWPVTIEDRDAPTIAKVLACKAPWALKGDELVARDAQVTDCVSVR